MRLGRLPHSPDRLAAAPELHRYGLAPPSARVDRAGIDFQPGLYANDTLPDCTAAGLANHATAAMLALAGAAPVIESQRVSDFYAACVGLSGAPETAIAATDGAVAMDVLERASRHGFDVGQQTTLVPAWGTCAGQIGIAGAVAHLGGAYLGITLYQRDMDTFGQGPWTVGVGDSGPELGGHVLVAWDYTGLGADDLVRLATWGALQPATWEWLLDRVDEAHGLVWRQLIAPGMDYDALMTRLNGDPQ